MAETPRKSTSILDQVGTIKYNFWIANIIEAFERLAFFGVRAVVPLYMFGTHSALGLSMSQKGFILFVWALLQCLVPMVSGGYTETYGYKKTMFTAFTVNILGYVLMANAGGFWTMLIAACCVGIGTAIFKPPVQGAVAASLNEANSSLGFGIFYWMVNVGGFVGPLVAIGIRGELEAPTWDYVFYGAALVTAVNFLPAIFLFREPPPKPDAPKKTPVEVFRETIDLLWQDKKMLRFLLVISGFFFMFMQLWDLLPNFIEEWVDTRDVGAWLPNLDPVLAWVPWMGEGWTESWLEADGRAKPELLINIDAFSILLFVIPLSWLLGKLRMMTSLLLGMAISMVGFVGAGTSTVGFFVAAMIFVFSIGEIACSPKFSEYIGMTAPPDKKAVYMGYSNIPFAIGWGLGNLFSGPLYDLFSSKANLARDWLETRTDMSKEAIAAIAPENLMETVAAALGEGASVFDARDVLWDAYHPWVIWVILGVVGLVSTTCIFVSYIRMDRGAEEEASSA